MFFFVSFFCFLDKELFLIKVNKKNFIFECVNKNVKFLFFFLKKELTACFLKRYLELYI